MIEQFKHKLTNSFMLWFDHFLMDKGQAYMDLSSPILNNQLYEVSDDRIDDSYNVYSSPFKEWVYDESIGPVVTGVEDSSGNSYGRDDGIIFDYLNGRVLYTGELDSPQLLPTNALTKEINVYYTNENEEDLIIDRKFDHNVSATGAIDPYDQVVPAAFFSINKLDNDPLAFGGEQTTKSTVSVTILAENPYQLDGVLSIFADSQDEVFKQIPMNDHPLNENGDLKNGEPYSYTGLSSQYTDKPFLIQEVTTSKLTSSQSQKELLNNLYVGFVDFDIYINRFRFS